MRSRGAAISLASSPALVGAVTVLVVVVAVFLSYNANRGLPFVPTYHVSVQVPNASTLVPGNEVRIGGVRVGQVAAVAPDTAEDGSLSAKVDLELDQSVEPLPLDSTVLVRSRSVLGLKYLEIEKGSSAEGLDQGGILPVAAARPEPVEVDELLNTFDEPTRAGVRGNLTEFGAALAGRGPQLNRGIEALRPVVELLAPTMKNLSAPRTDLRGFIRGLGAATAELAPVAETQAELFRSLDATFGGLARVARPHLQETITETPPTLRTLTGSLPRSRPFIRHTTGLFAELRPGFRALNPSAWQLAEAARVGVPALNAAPAFNAQLEPTAQSLVDFSLNPAVSRGIGQLDRLASTLTPPVSFITPAQTVCNYGTLLFRNVSSVLGLGDGTGTWQRFISLNPPAGPNSEGSPSSVPAAGPGLDNYLHANPYPNTAAPGQVYECEAGNEPYFAGQQMIGTVPGNQGTVTEEQPSPSASAPTTESTRSKCKQKKRKKRRRCLRRQEGSA